MKTGEVQLTEAALLGACLLNSKAALIAGDYVTASDFYAPKHQIIWDAIIGIMASGADPDPVSVAAALGNRVEEAGGQTYVLTLPSLCPAASNVRQYAQAVRDAATDRRVRAEINDALGKLEGEELLAVVQERMYQIDRRVEQATTMTEIWERMKANGTNPLPSGCEYPWLQVQLCTRGLRPGWLCVLAGESSHGKTAAALQITERNLQHGKRIVFLSLEMGWEEIGLRLAQHRGFSSDRYYSGGMNEADSRILSSVSCESYWDNLILDRVERATQIALLIRRWKPDLVVVDHLQLLAGSEKVEELSRATRALKLTAERFEVPILCLSQLSRAVREDHNKPPRISRLRGSGTIENDSDTVMFVWRKRDENEQLTDEASIIIAKVRMGKLGYIRAHFDGDVQTFTPVLAEGRVAGTADEFDGIEDF